MTVPGKVQPALCGCPCTDCRQGHHAACRDACPRFQAYHRRRTELSEHLRPVRTVNAAAFVLTDLVREVVSPGLAAAFVRAVDAARSETPEVGLLDLMQSLADLARVPTIRDLDVRAILHAACSALGASEGRHGPCAPSGPCRMARAEHCPWVPHSAGAGAGEALAALPEQALIQAGLTNVLAMFAREHGASNVRAAAAALRAALGAPVEAPRFAVVLPADRVAALALAAAAPAEAHAPETVLAAQHWGLVPHAMAMDLDELVAVLRAAHLLPAERDDCEVRLSTELYDGLRRDYGSGARARLDGALARLAQDDRLDGPTQARLVDLRALLGGCDWPFGTEAGDLASAAAPAEPSIRVEHLAPDAEEEPGVHRFLVDVGAATMRAWGYDGAPGRFIVAIDFGSDEFRALCDRALGSPTVVATVGTVGAGFVRVLVDLGARGALP